MTKGTRPTSLHLGTERPPPSVALGTGSSLQGDSLVPHSPLPSKLENHPSQHFPKLLEGPSLGKETLIPVCSFWGFLSMTRWWAETRKIETPQAKGRLKLWPGQKQSKIKDMSEEVRKETR